MKNIIIAFVLCSILSGCAFLLTPFFIMPVEYKAVRVKSFDKETCSIIDKN